MKWVVMKYIEILIAAGDQYFRGSLEDLPLAIQHYIEAAHILGPEPPKVPKLAEPIPLTIKELECKKNGKVDLELAFPFFRPIKRSGPPNSAPNDPNRESLQAAGHLDDVIFLSTGKPRVPKAPGPRK